MARSSNFGNKPRFVEICRAARFPELFFDLRNLNSHNLDEQGFGKASNLSRDAYIEEHILNSDRL